MEADFDPKDIGAIRPPVTEDPYLEQVDQRWNSAVEDLVMHKTATRSSLPCKRSGYTVDFGIDHAMGRFVMVLNRAGDSAIVDEDHLGQAEAAALIKLWAVPSSRTTKVIQAFALDLDPANPAIVPKMAAAVKKWMGAKPQVCDICQKPLKDVFIDGKTDWGPWANMCSKCHAVHGEGLGEGKGQKYNLDTLEKISHLESLVRVARARPDLLPRLRPAIRKAAEDDTGFRRVASAFPQITRTKWAGLTLCEKYAFVRKTAHRAYMLAKGFPLTKDAVRQGLGFVTYRISAEDNESKFYEGLIVPENGGYRVLRRYGALTDSENTGNIVGAKWDKDDKFWFQSLGQAKRELAGHFATRIAHKYIDAYGPKHVTPDGHKLPMGQYPVGLDRQVGFGWGTQSIARCVPALKTLAEQLKITIEAIRTGSSWVTGTQTLAVDVATPLKQALQTVRLVAREDSTMAQKLITDMSKVLHRLEGGTRYLPDPESKRLREGLVTILNYVTKQTSYCG